VADSFQGVRILGMDPGFENIGLAFGLFTPGRGIDLLEVKLVTTKKCSAKKGMRAKADDTRRLEEIVAQVDETVRHWDPDVGAFEECPSLRNSAVTRKIAMAWGAACALVTRKKGVLILEYGPKHLKKVVTGKEDASKQEMSEALIPRFNLLSETPVVQSKQEHLTDAVAAIVAASQDQAVIQLANVLRKVSS